MKKRLVHWNWIAPVCLTIVVMALVIMSYAQISQAAVIQQQGFFDTQYVNITNLDCINCHGADTSDRHHATYRAVNSDCSYCHQVVGGQMQVNRDCRSCHYATPHHDSTYALNGDCAACHSPDVVSSMVYDPGVYNAPSPVNPAQCRKCHTGDPLSTPPIGESRDLHRDTGSNCQSCHNVDLTTSIRLCEQCHQPKDLHNLHQNNCGGCHAPGNPAQLPPAVLKPAINALNVTSSLAGDTLIINGANFGAIAGSVKVGITSAVIVNWQDQSVTITVPAVAPGNYDIAVINSSGTSNVKVYTVLQGPDTIVTPGDGMPDRTYSSLTENDCRACHGATSDRHHAVYNAMQCNQCHQVVNNTVNNTVYDVVYDQVTVTRDCKVCHAANAHHNSGPAKAGICTSCHSNRIISDYNSVPKPVTLPGDTTPVSLSCNNCHKTSPSGLLHHETALDCLWCHSIPTDYYPIRTCENCHSVGTLHNVESHLKPQNCVGCHAARPDQFPVLPAGQPEIQFLSPNSGGPGATFTITGLDFGDSFDKGKVYFDVYNATVQYWDNSTVTVRVPDLPLGNYNVFVENPAGTSNRFDFTVTAPGALAGKVTDKSGAALAGAKVEIGTRSVTTDANGLYSIPGLAQGTYTVQVSAAVYTSASQTIDILNSLETKLDFILQKGGARSHMVSSTGYEAGSGGGCAGCHATDAATKEAELLQVHQNAGIPNYGCTTCHNPIFEGAGKVITGDGTLDMKINGATVIYCVTCHDGTKAHGLTASHSPEHQAKHSATGMTCSSCHSFNAAAGTATDITATTIHKNGCDTCHSSTVRDDVKLFIASKSGLSNPVYNCEDCHGIIHLGWDAKHKPTFPADPTMTCANCHNNYLPTEHEKALLPVTNTDIGYKLFRSTASTGPWTEIGSTTATGYANTGLTANTTYYYKVQAYDGKPNNSGDSNIVSVKTLVNAPVVSTVNPDLAKYASGNNGDSAADPTSTTDVLAKLTDNSTSTYSTVKENGSSDPYIFTKVNKDASVYSKVELKLSVRYYNGTNLTVYPYSTDTAVNTNTAYTVDGPSRSSSSSYTTETIDVTKAAQAMKDFGWMKFRIKPDPAKSASVYIANVQVVLTQSPTSGGTATNPPGTITPNSNDTTAPTAPSGLTGTAGYYDRVDLTWTASTDTRPGGDTCAVCHTTTATQRVKDAVTAKNANCSACHDIHPNLTTAHTGPVLATTPWNCSSCHTNILSTEHSSNAVLQNNAALNCDTCHKSNLARVQAAINSTVTDKSNLKCEACHTGTADGVPAVHADLAAPHLSGIFPTAADADCLKCHTTQANEFVSTKGGYHAVNGLTSKAAAGYGNYVSPWTAASQVGCKGCHGSNNDGKAQAANILKRPYTYLSNSGDSSMLCYLCHDYNTYGGSSNYTTYNKTGFRIDDSNYMNLHNISDHHTNSNGKFQCSFCHSTVPHATNKAHMVVTKSDPNSAGSVLTDYTHPASGKYTKSSCSTSSSLCDSAH